MAHSRPRRWRGFSDRCSQGEGCPNEVIFAFRDFKTITVQENAADIADMEQGVWTCSGHIRVAATCTVPEAQFNRELHRAANHLHPPRQFGPR